MDSSTATPQKPRRRLHYLVAGSIALAALLFTAITAFNQYFRHIDSELVAMQRTLSQLAATLEDTAAVAAYLDNDEIAREVTQGLVKNDIVLGAALISESGMSVSAGSINASDTANQFQLSLQDPFVAGETVGRIIIQPNSQKIQNQAESAALNYAGMLAIHNFLITVLVMLLVDRLLARPLTQLASQLHETEPGSGELLEIPRWHRHDEIGGLVKDTNELLQSVHSMLKNERQLRSRVELLQKRFRIIFERASAGIFLMQPDGILLISNKAFDEIIGTELGKQMREHQQPRVMELFKNEGHLKMCLAEMMRHEKPQAIDLELIRTSEKGVSWVHCLFSSVFDDEGNRLIEGLLNDVTERTHREQRFQYDAAHDPLTRLLNRRAGEMQIQQALNGIDDGSPVAFALMLIDLDRFKPVNDKFGHEAGDLVLVEVTRRLRDAVRGEDIVIRWGGDEFVVGLLRGSGELDPVPVAKKLIDRISRPITLDTQQNVVVGASIGIALAPAHGSQLEELVTRADQTMYRVKQTGRSNYLVFHDGFVGECKPENSLP